MEKRKVYFDHIATTPLRKEALEAMLPFLREKFGNPQSLNSYADEPRQAIEEARAKVAQLINANSEEIIFTSGGAEANNMAIKGVAKVLKSHGNHIITSAIEHFSVLHPLKGLEKEGFEVTYLPVDKSGLVDPGELKKALRKETILASIMLANNEVGIIEPIKDLARVVKENSLAYFHADAVVAIGQILVDVLDLGVDLLSLSAHQFYGPKGVGAIFVKQGTRIIPMIEGGIQEGGRRAGIENVAGIVGTGKAAELIGKEISNQAIHLESLREKLKAAVERSVDHIYFTGHPTKRLPGHLSLCVEFIEGEAMLMLLDSSGIAAASGSTCTSKALKASHVLLALGLPPEVIQGSLVLSLGRENDEEDVAYFAETFPPIVARLRQMSPLYTRYLIEREKK